MTLADRILEAIRYAPLDDDVLARRLGVAQRQSVNQAARRLEAQGRLRRYTGSDGKIVKALPDAPPPPPRSAPVAPVIPISGPEQRITEDEVKQAVGDHLAAEGFDVVVAWGRVRGIDIDARHPDGRRIIIEAKSEAGANGPQLVNYFLGMLGELLQRMDDPGASYGIALPANKQYRGLVDRFPTLARERLELTIFWVTRGPEGLTVTVE